MLEARLQISPGVWYGWQMLPGYGEAPYFSPIRMDAVEPLKTGRSLIRLHFFNAGYAQGVADFCKTLRVMKRERSYLLAELRSDDGNHPTDRSAVISVLTFEWLDTCFGHLLRAYPPSRFGPGADVQTYIAAALREVSRHAYG